MKHGVEECSRGDFCRLKDDGGASTSNDDAKWCTSCVASGKGFRRPVCKKYHCPKCEKKNKKLDLPAIDISQAAEIFEGRRALIGDDSDDKSDESSSSVVSDNSWHPEYDLTLRKKKYQHYQRTVCQLFNTSCYNECAKCGEVSCKECIKQLGEKWLQCETCFENFFRGADAYTGSGRFFVHYCTNCKHKSARCEGDECEGDGKLDYYEEDEEGADA